MKLAVEAVILKPALLVVALRTYHTGTDPFCSAHDCHAGYITGFGKALVCVGPATAV